MIDTNELRKLTQEATPGPWEVYGLDQHGQAIIKGEHIEIATCWHHCVGSIEKEMHANAAFIAAANPAAVSELLDHLEAAEQAVQDCLRIDREKAQIAQKLEAVDRAWKESDKSCRDLTEKVIPNIRERLESAKKERDALRAKIAEMEQQEPVAWYSKQYGFVYMSRHHSQFERGSILYLRNGTPAWRIEGSSKVALLDIASLPHGTVFYAIPGAKGE